MIWEIPRDHLYAHFYEKPKLLFEFARVSSLAKLMFEIARVPSPAKLMFEIARVPSLAQIIFKFPRVSSLVTSVRLPESALLMQEL